MASTELSESARGPHAHRNPHSYKECLIAHRTYAQCPLSGVYGLCKTRVGLRSLHFTQHIHALCRTFIVLLFLLLHIYTHTRALDRLWSRSATGASRDPSPCNDCVISQRDHLTALACLKAKVAVWNPACAAVFCIFGDLYVCVVHTDSICVRSRCRHCRSVKAAAATRGRLGSSRGERSGLG